MVDQFRNLFRLSNPEGTGAQFSTPSGFSGLFEHAHLTVFRYLYGLTGGPAADVEDLTAETFSRAWKTRRAFQGDESGAVGWLLTIARRLVIDEYRRRKSRPVVEWEPSDALPDPAPEPEQVALVGEEHALLLRQLQSLPENSREMLVLRYVLGWRVNRIAAFLGISENTASVSIHRALEHLRRGWPHHKEVQNVRSFIRRKIK